MRWGGARHGRLKPLPLLPLLLVLVSFHGPWALGQHVARTCPVNPFHSFEQPTSCARIDDRVSSTSTAPDESKRLNHTATSCPTAVNATSQPASSDDRTAIPTKVTEGAAKRSQDYSSVIPSPSHASASSARWAVKEQVWTEIDDSLGQSWTPELEAEYAQAQREYELQTQAASESVQQTASAAQHGEAASFDDGINILEFPSFAEWKERHLAAGLAATSAQSSRDSKNDARDVRSHHHKDAKPFKPEEAGKSTEDTEASDSVSPLSGSLEDLLSVPDKTAQRDQDDEQVALIPDTQRILHPVPHAGSGDPLLDPLVFLRDRTNYASFDCSATLIRSSKSTKFASAILSSKKDRYMLSPCSETEKYVIVELCDEIQIDNIILANLEFFSSMFKMFRVSGGTAYPESAGGWREIGTFRASNARGLQVFRPPEPSKGGFYRYLRIDFLSHYGSEYYCPVSLLKVYGLTQLDAYRRDEERESRLASADEQAIFVEMEGVQTEQVPEDPVLLQLVDPVKVEARNEADEQVIYETISTVHGSGAISEVGLTSSAASAAATPASSVWSVSITVPPSYSKATPTAGKAGQCLAPTHELPDKDPLSETRESHDWLISVEHELASRAPTSVHPRFSQLSQPSSPVFAHSPILSEASTSTVYKAEGVPAGPLQSESIKAGDTSTAADNLTQTPQQSSSARTLAAPSSTSRSSGQVRSSSPSITYRTFNSAQQATASPARRNDSKPQVLYTHGHHSTHQPNESIYGTIMKRLLALEVNSTLSNAYFEEQSRMIWDTFRRIEDRLLTAEKSRAKYDQLLRRVMLDLELHRARHEAERTELSGQLSVLSREMVMEKRLGIAQLIALVILMFFVVLTRGSPSSPILNLAQQRSTASSATFPPSIKTRRPRSLRDEPLDTFPTLDFRSASIRERRGMGSGSRGSMYANTNGHSRNASIKRPAKASNGMTKRPGMVLPLKKNGIDYSNTASEYPSPLGAPAMSLLSTSAPSESSMSLHASRRTSRAPSPINGIDPVILGLADNELSSSTITLRGLTPPLHPAVPKIRRGPVDTLRRKLKLMQPRRASSLDGTDVPEVLKHTSSGTLPPASSSVLDRRKRFSINTPSFLRDRSDTMSSLASEGDEGNSKAWLSTSEDSGDENGRSTTSLGSSSFSDFSKHSAQNSPSHYVPPSPDPSDADTPGAHYQDLPSTSRSIVQSE